MGDAVDLIVFGIVVALRLGVPLLIPRFPLPAVITCLILDGVDQTIFQNFTDLDLTGYQSYDKALDIYYLTVAYLSTFRSWDNFAAFEMSRFLYYFRLAGVALFEITHTRALLLFFPNTFEYFFIFYEAVRLRWNPVRMSATLVVLAAGAIWVFIKVPQEYWIHIAQLDVTDELEAHPAAVPILAVAIVALLAVAWWLIMYRCPPADRKLSFVVEDPFGEEAYRRMTQQVSEQGVFNLALVEKLVMISLVNFIFSQILPNLSATTLQLTVGIGILIVANTAISEWLARRGVGWDSTIREFGAMLLVNLGIAVVFRLVLPEQDGSIRIGNTLFFLFIVTLLVTLHDRYRPFHLLRQEQLARAIVGKTPA
jgi:hypothetical protein